MAMETCPACQNESVDMENPVNQAPPTHPGSILFCPDCQTILIFDRTPWPNPTEDPAPYPRLRGMYSDEYQLLPAPTKADLQARNTAAKNP